MHLIFILLFVHPTSRWLHVLPGMCSLQPSNTPTQIQIHFLYRNSKTYCLLLLLYSLTCFLHFTSSRIPNISSCQFKNITWHGFCQNYFTCLCSLSLSVFSLLECQSNKTYFFNPLNLSTSWSFLIPPIFHSFVSFLTFLAWMFMEVFFFRKRKQARGGR